MSETKRVGGRFAAPLKEYIPGEGQMSVAQFRGERFWVDSLRDFLDTPTGVALRMVLNYRRAALLAAVPTMAGAAAAHLAKMQATEELCSLLVNVLPAALAEVQVPQSRKGGAVGVNVAVMP